jgi:acetolactate synthase I/II/III large subunit
VTVAGPSKPPARPLTAGEAVAQALVAHGVDRLFLMTGGDLSLWISLRDTGIQLCLARSEAGSVAMADAYARMTGRTAVVYGQWGPGAANVAAALADAHWAGSPVLALTSTVSTAAEYRFAYQDLDQPAMFAPVTKWRARINRADRAADTITQALRWAESGPAGPVHIDIPSDVLSAPLGVDCLAPIGDRPMVIPPSPGAVGIDMIVAKLRSAQRPVILAGAGLATGGGTNHLLDLVEIASLPVVTSMGGKGSISEDHPLAMGVAGRYSRKCANQVLREADFVLVLGSDLGGLASDTYRLPTAQADIVQIDLDASTFGRTREVSLALVADAGDTCRCLADALRGAEPVDRSHWVAHVRGIKAGWMATFETVAHRPADGHVRPEAIAWILREVVADNDIVMADTGFAGAWAGTLFPVRQSGRTFTRAAGTLGWAFPAVLGAQLARPDVRVFALIGDGGMGYNVGDIETAVRLGIPAITIVLNNSCLAYERVLYEIAFEGNVVDEVCDFSDTNFAAVATALGAFGRRVDSAESFRAALVEAIAQDQPAIIDVIISNNRFAPVTSFDAFVTREL